MSIPTIHCTAGSNSTSHETFGEYPCLPTTGLASSKNEGSGRVIYHRAPATLAAFSVTFRNQAVGFCQGGRAGAGPKSKSGVLESGSRVGRGHSSNDQPSSGNPCFV